MNALIIILLVIAALVAIILIIPIFQPDKYRLVREVVINKPVPLVFSYIKLLNNQKNYNKWVMADPNARMETRGIDGTPGFVTTWDSENKNVGKGEQEIKKVVENEKIEIEIRFIKPFTSTMLAILSTSAMGAGETKVRWSIEGDQKYAIRILHLVLNMKKMLGNDMQTSLNNLKNVLEK